MRRLLHPGINPSRVEVFLRRMLLKYLVPVAGLVALQLFLNRADAQVSTELAEAEHEDLETSEIFLRPVVIKYGHDHPGKNTGNYSQFP